LTPPGAPAPMMKSLAQIEPRTDVLTLTGDVDNLYIITRPGSYYLTTNIVAVGGKSGIQISSSDVSLDLNGFSMIGSGAPRAIYSGVTCNRIRVRNGHISGWASGIDFFVFATGADVVVEDLEVIGTGAAFSYGVATGDGARICRCRVAGFSGNSGAGISTGGRSVVERCQAESNYQGIAVGNQSSVTDCSVLNSMADAIITVNSSVVRNNRVDGGVGGISCSANCVVSDNNCVSTRTSGISVSGSFNRIENNQALFNNFGIQTPLNATNFVARNVAHGNTNGNFNLLGSVISGPTVVGTGIVTNHPWANFSY
jgi:hypothetical protein